MKFAGVLRSIGHTCRDGVVRPVALKLRGDSALQKLRPRTVNIKEAS